LIGVSNRRGSVRYRPRASSRSLGRDAPFVDEVLDEEDLCTAVPLCRCAAVPLCRCAAVPLCRRSTSTGCLHLSEQRATTVRHVVSVGPVIVGVGLAMLARMASGTSYPSVVLPAVLVFGLGLGVTIAPLTATAMGALRDEHPGLASALNNDVARVGGLIAVAILPAVAGISGAAYLHPGALAHGFRLAVLVTAAWCVAGGLAAAVGVRNPPGTEYVAARPAAVHCAIDASPLATVAARDERPGAGEQRGRHEKARWRPLAIPTPRDCPEGRARVVPVSTLLGVLTHCSSTRDATFYRGRHSGRMTDRSISQPEHRRGIALLAHENKKLDLLEWARYNRVHLVAHELFATATTGALLADELGLPVNRLQSGPLGGDLQIGAKITEGAVDLLLFFWDPLEPQPHDPDVKALLRIAVVWNIPVACNRATADFLITSPLFDADYCRIVPPYSSSALRPGTDAKMPESLEVA
jgi:methylglyoxal synthase